MCVFVCACIGKERVAKSCQSVLPHLHTSRTFPHKAQHEISEKGERDSARAGAPTIVETLTPRDTLAGYIVALRTGTVMFSLLSFADIAVLRKALESSPIAQAIVM